MNKLQKIFPMLIFILVSFSLFVVFLSFDFFFCLYILISVSLILVHEIKTKWKFQMLPWQLAEIKYIFLHPILFQLAFVLFQRTKVFVIVLVLVNCNNPENSALPSH